MSPNIYDEIDNICKHFPVEVVDCDKLLSCRRSFGRRVLLLYCRIVELYHGSASASAMCRQGTPSDKVVNEN